MPRTVWPALAVVATVLGLIALALGALLAHGGGSSLTALLDDTYLRRVIGFTLTQAALSTVLSVGLAIPVARALARRSFRGRGWLLRLYGLPLVIPAIVAVLGVVQVYGVNGVLNRALAATFGSAPWQGLYGLPGILIAHVFFNLPLAVRLLLPLWSSVPGETWRLAGQLGFAGPQVWRLIEWPLLRQGLTGVATLVFMLCFTSFAIVLALGGGPGATTVEVAIYQALRFDFDPPRAAVLALVQLALCAGLAVLLQGLQRDWISAAAAERPAPRPDTAGRAGRLADGLLLTLATVFVAAPVAMVVIGGVTGPLARVATDPAVLAAVGRSLAVALPAATLAVAAGVAVVLGSRRLRLHHRPQLANLMELGGSVILVCPPLVLGAGAFLLLRYSADRTAVALAVVALVNALMALPFVIRALSGPAHTVASHHDRLCASLGLSGWRRLAIVDWPLLRRPLALGAALAACLSLGDLGVIALFGSRDTTTLPLLLYQRLSSYRLEDAGVIALLLLAVCLALFMTVERIAGRGGE